MPHVDTHEEDIEFESPTLVEGLPGVGLVGKIAVDHLVEIFDMQHYASIYCDGLPQVGVYREDDTSIRPPVRVHADRDRDLLVLQSDVPVSPSEAPEFAVCLTDWITDSDITPVYLGGLPTGTRPLQKRCTALPQEMGRLCLMRRESAHLSRAG